MIYPNWIYPNWICPNLRLIQNLADGTGADSSAAFANGEAQSFIHGDGGDQLDNQLYVVAGHHHFGAFRHFRDTGNIRRPEVELRTITLEERCRGNAGR